ncbi:MAG: 3-phosphoshikimate 1-carboxyvinyltransferase [Verrucomicrobia bacterium]|nr:3-phosphoshikimate 1-carboxyvinyltransferase [Verrucomicrobiota bacterium]
MPLPPLIEIIPLTAPVRAEITMPGSKSITNRALVLAALADGETILRGALWSEDTQVMVECLQELGFMVNVAPEPDEICNRTITIYGLGGKVPRGGTAEQPLELFVGNAGTAARFLAAMVCLGGGVYRLHGVPRMHERPQAALFAALRQLGYRVDSPNNKLPALIFGCSSRGDEVPSEKESQSLLTSSATHEPRRACTVSVAESSQFASALLLCAKAGRWSVEISGANEDELPYVEMTRQLGAVFPEHGGRFQIEPDASSGSYFWAATSSPIGHRQWPISVAHWPCTGWQIDAEFPKRLPLPATLSRQTDLADSIMTAIVIAPLAGYPVKFTDLGRLRVQECERVVALRTELTKCGAKVIESGDTLEVFPSALHGAEIETYNDHRMAMCFAILGLKVPGIKIKNPACVKKTFPNFFQKLAAPPPHGLGAEIRDATDGRRLRVEELFAE